MTRVVLTLALLFVAVVMTIITVLVSESVQLPDLLLNLGAEIVGIALTVAIVDWLIERNKLRYEAERLAWQMLHEIDHVVWVWQGGRREFQIGELLGLLDLVTDEDPILPTTQGMMVNVGVRASDMLRLHRRLFTVRPQLREGLARLADLAQMRELNRLMTPSFVVEAVCGSIRALSRVTDEPIGETSAIIARKFRDPSEESQARRYRGSIHDWTVGEGWRAADADEPDRRPEGAFELDMDEPTTRE